MSKELDTQVLNILKELCDNSYNRPTEFDSKSLEKQTESSVFQVSHSLNNLQRNGFIQVHIGKAGESNKVELLKQQL